MLDWFEVREPDNPMSLNIAAIAYIMKDDKGCVIVTFDATRHNFHGVSYEQMMDKLREAKP